MAGQDLGQWTDENPYASVHDGTQPRYPSNSDDIEERVPGEYPNVPGNEENEASRSAITEPFDVIEPAAQGFDPTFPLNSRDVCAFIVNKMIGTGIFVNPPAVLILTQNKGEALGLWALGFAYTLISTVIYLEFARKLPHTGGELIYLDETIPKIPVLLAYTVYTFYFVPFYNTATNCMEFANQVLISANVENPNYDPTQADQRLLRFFAIVALSFFCFLHYFSGRVGRALNQVLAAIKVLLLVVVFCAGCARAKNHFESDWTGSNNNDKSNSAAAFLLILFSFSGWENATFIAGEIKNHQILRRGFVAAVLIVGILYLMVNLVFLLAIPYDDITSLSAVDNYVPVFFGGGYKAKFVWAILIAISASGSLLSVIYTCARVKQIIGMSNLLPWSKIWRSTHPPTQLEGNGIPTPKGGLMLHWITSTALILITAAIHNLQEAISFPGLLQVYASGWVGIFIAIGFPFLYYEKLPFVTPRQLPPTRSSWTLTNDRKQIERLVLIKSKLGIVAFAFLYLAFNLYIVVVNLIETDVPREIKEWYYVVIIAGIFVVGITYYYATIGLTIPAASQENSSRYPKRSILWAAGVQPELIVRDAYDGEGEVRKKIRIIIPQESDTPSSLYWFFGGSDESHLPNSRRTNLWHRFNGH